MYSIAALVYILTLLTVFIRAEESSILDGATIANKDRFKTNFAPDLDHFFGVGFKTRLCSYVGGADASKELKIQLAEQHAVVTVFFVVRVGSNTSWNRRADKSEVWVGDNADDWSASFT